MRFLHAPLGKKTLLKHMRQFKVSQVESLTGRRTMKQFHNQQTWMGLEGGAFVAYVGIFSADQTRVFWRTSAAQTRGEYHEVWMEELGMEGQGLALKNKEHGRFKTTMSIL